MSIRKFRFAKSDKIMGLQIIDPFEAIDNRGVFTKTFEENILKENGIEFHVVEIEESFSKKGVLRGLHMQHTFPQSKFVRVVQGEIFDVAVDIRKKSPTYGKYFGMQLSSENKKMIYIPAGCLHGFLCLRDNTIFNCYCDVQYHPECDGGVVWNDRTINIKWPLNEIDEVILSDKDKNLPKLENYKYYIREN